VARAKRTDRAEARRAYRAYLQAQDEAGLDDESPAADEPIAGRWRFPGAPKATSIREATPAARAGAPLGQARRLSFWEAAKGAYRAPHYGEDIRGIGSLIFRSNAIWPILILCAAAVAFALSRKPQSVTDINNDFMLSLVFTWVLSSGPMIPAMLAGILAPKASWLAGAVAAVISSVSVLVFAELSAFQIDGVTGTIGLAPLSALAVLLMQSVPLAIFMAAAAAWYKRFLPLISPPRPAGARPSKRPAPQRRRPSTRG
jgi:hypothetical protein